MGGLDSSVLERIAKIMSYMTVAGEAPCLSVLVLYTFFFQSQGALAGLLWRRRAAACSWVLLSVLERIA